MEEKAVALLEKYVDVGMVLRYAGAVVAIGVISHILTWWLRRAEGEAAKRAGRASWLQTSPAGAYVLPVMPVVVAVALSIPLRLAGFLAPYLWVLVAVAAAALGYTIHGVIRQRLGLKAATTEAEQATQQEAK